jgi:adenosylmethionine-8-amino-7-oxononanoate aminotransferase
MSVCPLLRDPFPRSVFVTGTGTDIGKTLCSAVLCALWEADYWKPVQTGEVSDALEILRLSPGTPIHLSTYQFAEPASPHWSAQLEQERIDLPFLVENLPEGYFTVVEGAGGALVPLNDQEDMIDLAQALDLPMVVVAPTGLGTLHHALATVHAIRARGAVIAGVLLNGPSHGENARQIRDRGRVDILGRVPELYPTDAQSIAELIQQWKMGDWADPCAENTPIQATKATSKTLAERDAQVVWHPFTQHQTAHLPLEIKSAHGALLHSSDGAEIIDAVSSWWVTNHGHTHPKIIRAVSEQAKTLEQVIFADCTHEPAVALAEELLPLLPGGMSRLFYSDDGSTAVEVALKACIQIARQNGVPVPRVAALEDAYHGDTLGAMSAGARSVFSQPFDPYLFQVDRLPTPAGSWDPSSPEAQTAAKIALDALENWVDAHTGEIACVIVEPLIQGSAGMRMYPRTYLEGLDALCRERGVPWIADEVFTGFGRTGRMFACDDLPDRPSLHPSAICLSKGLTGGFLPLGATAFRESIFQQFLSDDRSRTFFHGHSFTGSPLGCAAALASLRILREPWTPRRWKILEGLQRRFLSDLAERNALRGARVLGTIAAFELPEARDGYLAMGGDELAPRGSDIARACRGRGVLVRPLGDTLYVVPPWNIREVELERVYDALGRSIQSAGSKRG